MAGIVFGVFCTVSVICAAVTGNFGALGNALFSGTEDAVGLMLSLGGAMCLWGGFLEVLREMGALSVLQRMLYPILRRLFPELCRDADTGLAEITASLAANLLGIGNAATPIGLKAMEQLRLLRQDKDRMSNAEIMFAVLNTAPPTLLPTTLLALRYAAGSSAPTAVLPAVWAVSLLGFLFSAVVTRMLAHQGGRTGGIHQ